MDLILKLKSMTKKRLENGKNTYIAFIDLKNVFDEINWRILFKNVKRIRIDVRDRKIIYGLHTTSEISKINDKWIKTNIKKEIPLYFVLPPLLFNLYMK